MTYMTSPRHYRTKYNANFHWSPTLLQKAAVKTDCADDPFWRPVLTSSANRANGIGQQYVTHTHTHTRACRVPKTAPNIWMFIPVYCRWYTIMILYPHRNPQSALSQNITWNWMGHMDHESVDPTCNPLIHESTHMGHKTWPTVSSDHLTPFSCYFSRVSRISSELGGRQTPITSSSRNLKNAL